MIIPRYLLIFLVFVLTGCEKTKRVIDLNYLLDSRSTLYLSYLKYDGSKQIPYAYCDSIVDLHNVVLIYKGSDPYLLITCLAVDSTFERAKERSRFFKYSTLDKYGQLRFCGWRDNYIKLNDDYSYKSVSPKVGLTGKCPSVSVSMFLDL